MRDRRFVAEHRGGLLKKEQHRQLMIWACACAEHVLPLAGEKIDGRLKNALAVAKEWAEGKATVGDARNSAFQAIAVANESSDPVAVSLARAVGHAVATAHMADHSMGAALYGLKALKFAGKSIETERRWQNEQLPPEIREMVVSEMINKGKVFKIF